MQISTIHPDNVLSGEWGALIRVIVYPAAVVVAAASVCLA